MTLPSQAFQETGDGASPKRRKLPSIQSLFHPVWLNKWVLIGIWVALAIPLGAVLAIFDIPRSYSASTILRFPSVIGAQTNVMRDVAITQRESIVSIFQSYQVLEATVKKLRLQLRIRTPEVFFHDTFTHVAYEDNLGPGVYTLVLEPGGNGLVTYRPAKGNDEYAVFKGPIKRGRIAMPGLTMEFQERALQVAQRTEIKLEMLQLENAILDLREATSTRSLGASNFQVTMKDRDPRLVSDMLNTLREEFLKVYYGTTEVQEVGVLAQMEKDLEIAKARLAKSQDALDQFYSAHPELMRARQSGGEAGDPMALLEARAELNLLENRRQRLESMMAAKVPNADPEQAQFWANELLGVMAEAGSPKANILRASLADANQKLLQARQTLGPDHPRLAEISRSKEDIFKQVESAQAELSRSLAGRKAELSARIAGLTAPRSTGPSVKVELELSRLSDENRNNQNMYDRVMESYNRAKLVTGAEFFKVTVVDPARPALYEPPSWRGRAIVAAAAVTLLFLVIPVAYAAWNLVFQKIWTKEDVRKLIGCKVLGTLGWNAPASASAGAARKARAGRAKAGPAGPEARPAGPAIDPMLLFYGSNYTLEELEAFRVIREEAESFFQGTENQDRLCLLVTSCRPGEGKSISAANLAMAFARKGKRTLLIDADFRLGRQKEIFDLPVTMGLDELLSQPDITKDRFLEMASLAFQSTMQWNLVVAPRSRPNAGAGELVSSDRFKDFVRLAQEQFEVVIIDTPPVMITPEPLSLADLADGVVFICLSGRTSVNEVREADESFRERGVDMAVVLNGIRNTPFEQNRYKKYAYYYTAAGQSEPQPKKTT